jgi:hypothetical protein
MGFLELLISANGIISMHRELFGLNGVEDKTEQMVLL